jgi:type IV secretory pathway VirB10-like protein
MRATNIFGGQAKRQPRGVSPSFAIALTGGFLLGLLAFFVALERRRPPAPTMPALREARGDDTWFERVTKPTPATHPSASVFATPSTIQPPAQIQTMPYQRPNAEATLSEDARERRERYRKALASDVTIKADRQVLETPRLVGTGNAPATTSPIVVAAQPAPPHTITAWTWIYGTLETGIESDHPGDVLGRVSQDVKDSVTQTEVLIPTGSKLHGYQGGRPQVERNDTSLLVTWDDIEFPNGAHIPLPHMPGADTAGYPGFEDLVNNHYARTWTPALLISGITAATMLASRPTYGSTNGYNPEQEALGAGAESLGTRAVGQLGADFGSAKPTLTIRPGYEFRILVTRDLVFSGPYKQ